jgi:predicted amidohydrolase YtcJ
MVTRLLLGDVELSGAGRTDVRVAEGRVDGIGRLRPGRGDAFVAGAGRALLPGLHDHHCHVLATAAASASVQCGPPEVRTARALEARLWKAQPSRGWIRGTGYDESVAGALDAAKLDRLSPLFPTRIQHRSGALWVVNSAGAKLLGLDGAQVDGIELDRAGQPTGRLWRVDAWLRDRLGGNDLPDVKAVSARLASRGVTGVTDATVDLAPEAVEAILDGGLTQRLVSLGRRHADPRAALGPRKLIVSDHELPSFEALLLEVRDTRPRPIAVHCVTPEALVLTLAVIAEAGPVRGDRIEHAAVCPPELAGLVAALGLAVVTQPSLAASRGDDYLDRVEREQLPHLWPFAGLLDAGIGVGCSSDAPYGWMDPWTSVAAAVERRSMSGREVAPRQRVDAFAALNGYLTAPHDPGGPARRLSVGGPADLCLLDRPLADVLARPADTDVLLTLIDGQIAHLPDPSLLA